MTELVFREITHEIIGSAFEVHNEIGGGHKEHIYQKSLAICLRKRGLKVEEQVRVDLMIHDEKIGMYYLDFLINDKVVIEIKSSKFFRQSDFRQTVSYLQSLNKKLGLLIAFTPTGVRYKRVLNLPNYESGYPYNP